MNYEEMSDHEINTQVTSIIFGCEKWSLSESNLSFYHCGLDGSGFYEQLIIDYCNNPSDAWPIIVGNGIGVTPHGEKWMANNFNPSNVGSYQVQTMSYDKNPLRAAMIVFLMMKEQSK